jgi:hypothetical protein
MMRKLGLLGTLMIAALAISACASNRNHDASRQAAPLSPEDQALRYKFRGIYGGVLRIDAATRKEYVTIKTEAGWSIEGAAALDLDRVDNSTHTGDTLPIPKFIHATWRIGPARYDGNSRSWTGGTIIGDYTVPVAERVPDDILDYIRKNGGALRLKIRLKDDGILIGWDVEQHRTNRYGTFLEWVLPGGDFREAQIFNGKVTDPGWQH